MPRLITTAAFAALLLTTLIPAQSTADPEARALWITRWDYTEPDHVRAIVENAASLNFNILLFQVRGNGTVFYPSAIEPWAWELTSDGPETTGQDPGWDPLALAIEEAHARDIELHVYMNVFPAWRSQDYPPRDSGQLWWEHPDWFMCDSSGRRMIPRDPSVPYADPIYGGPLDNTRREAPPGLWYSFISPGVPEVQDYLASVFEEIAANYEIDGIHFDYIRYPAEIREVSEGYGERARELGNWSYDPVSLARFTRETGVVAPDASPEAWIQWRCDQITATVRQTRERVDAVRPGVIISAAVMPNPQDAHDTKYQDYIPWMEDGLLDCAMTMGYTASAELFRTRTENLMWQRPSQGYVVPGLSFGNGPGPAIAEIEIARELGGDGFAGFAYSSLFDRNNGHIRRPLADALAEGPLAEPAPRPW
jgi:uncharacterized lipoprotein YddW (UPF0748 family)